MFKQTEPPLSGVKETNRLRRTAETRHDAARQELSRTEGEIRNIVEAVKAGFFAPAMKAEMEALEARANTLRAQIAGAKDRQAAPLAASGAGQSLCAEGVQAA